MQESNKTALILFAKEPQPGRVKTRLIPKLGEQGACDLYRNMLLLQLERFNKFPDCSFSLHISPDKSSAFATDLKQRYGIKIEQQYGDGLGERMFQSLSQVLKYHHKAILFGADCPFIDESVMQAAIEALEQVSLVFVPAEDGGYMLIGARQIDPTVFNHIDWSTEQVMQQTRQQIERLSWSYKELSPLADIDRVEDLALLKNTPLVLNSYE